VRNPRARTAWQLNLVLGVKMELREMHMVLRAACLTLILTLTAANLTYAADQTGNFWRGGGVGGVACPEFVATMERARSHGIDSPAYVNETQGYIMYIVGFRTGYNMSAAGTCDIFNGEEDDLYPLLVWSENWCRAHSKRTFSDAVIALAVEKQPGRMKRCNH
jgi:hypothetical protein